MHSSPHKNLFIGLGLFALCSAGSSATAAATAFYTANGVGTLGNPQGWGGTNNTGESVAFELVMDFTTNVDNETRPIDLWEAGATGSGAALVLDGDDLLFFAGNSPTSVISGSHGLSATQSNVQIVSVFEISGGNELFSLYVNGIQIASGDFATADIWAGSDAGALGTNSGNARYFNSALVDQGQIQDYPTNDISLAVYRLASSGGDPDNTLGNILVAPIPEPSSLALAGLGSLLLLRRRR